MKTSIVRKEIHDYVDQADGRFLALVHSMVEVEKKGNQEYFLKAEMIRRATLSEMEISEGKTISSEQFNVDFKQWKEEKRQHIK